MSKLRTPGTAWRPNETLQALFDEPFLTRWLFDVEILARWIRAHPDLAGPKLERRLLEHPLECWTDVAGSRLALSDCVAAPLHLWRIWRHYSG